MPTHVVIKSPITETPKLDHAESWDVPAEKATLIAT
jgi:hypothetical protein